MMLSFMTDAYLEALHCFLFGNLCLSALLTTLAQFHDIFPEAVLFINSKRLCFSQISLRMANFKHVFVDPPDCSSEWLHRL